MNELTNEEKNKIYQSVATKPEGITLQDIADAYQVDIGIVRNLRKRYCKKLKEEQLKKAKNQQAPAPKPQSEEFIRIQLHTPNVYKVGDVTLIAGINKVKKNLADSFLSQSGVKKDIKRGVLSVVEDVSEFF